MKKHISKIALISTTVFMLLFNSCQKDNEFIGQNDKTNADSPMAFKLYKNHYPGLTENFETGTKTTFTAADIKLTGGIWNFNNALIGTSASDKKNGTKSVRIQQTGKITMKFDVTSGAGIVSFSSAKYGTNGSSNIELWYSTNAGTNWTIAGTAITVSSTNLQQTSYTINKGGNVRFEIRKTTGTSYCVNIDDLLFRDTVLLLAWMII